MQLDDLRLFCAVATQKSFSAAAKQLSVPLATLSRRVSNLEQQLNTALLHRSTRTIQVSEAGLALLQRAAPLIEEFEALNLDMASRQTQARGTLRLQIPQDLFADNFVTCLHGFMKRFPDITVECQQYLGRAHHSPNNFDLTLITYELNLPSSDWIAVPLLSLTQGLFCSPTRLGIQTSGVLSPQDLPSWPLIAHNDETLWHFRQTQSVESVSVNSRLRLESLSQQIQAAQQGLGIIKAPLTAVEAALDDQSLIAIDTSVPPVGLSVALYYRSRVQPARTKVFMDYLQRFLASGNP